MRKSTWWTFLSKPISLSGGFFRSRVVAILLGLAALGVGVAGASIPDANGTIHGCYNTLRGTLRVIDSPTATCGNQETALSWNQTGQTAGTNTLYLASMDYFTEYRSTRFNGLDLPAGTYLVGAKGSMTSTAYGGCYLVSGPEGQGVVWDSSNYDNDTSELAVVLFAKVTLTETSTNVAMVCGNGFGETWFIYKPVMWAVPVAP